MMPFMNISAITIISIIAFIPALVLHEMGHAYAAYKLGDPTAQKAGRLSFNPLNHIDLFGTVLLPLMLAALNMPIFGYAKPVPYNPRYFKDPRKGDLIVGLSGPLANLIQALLGTLVVYVMYIATPMTISTYNSGLYYLAVFFVYYIYINLILLFFNILPIPPLDGSSIFAFFIPEKSLPTYYRIEQYAFPVFMIVIILLPQIFNVDPFSWYLNVTAYNVWLLLLSFIG